MLSCVLMNTTTPIKTTLLSKCQQILAEHPSPCLYLGYSGGRDSHVLLDLLAHLQHNQRLSSRLIAIHVDHRLQPHSDDWAKHCQHICDNYHIPLIIETVSQQPQKGESIEAFARKARYQLIKKHLNHKHIFISAHHRRDQAETFLLQLMRGAGLDGLRAMPVCKAFGEGYYLRPLLNVDYGDIVTYAKQQQLNFIDDYSNSDLRFDRNYIRHQVLPVLNARFPQAERSIARSATWLGEIPNNHGVESLHIDTLLTKPRQVQKQLIRQFIKHKTAQTLSEKQTHYLLDHHLSAASDKQPQLLIKNHVIRRYRGEIIVTKRLPQPAPDACFHQILAIGVNHVIPSLGTLTWQSGAGLLAKANQTYHLRPLRGQTRFHPQTRTHSTTVNKLLYEYGIAPWLRPWQLGIYCGDELLAIPGIGVAKPYYRQAPKAYTPQWIIPTDFVKL